MFRLSSGIHPCTYFAYIVQYLVFHLPRYSICIALTDILPTLLPLPPQTRRIGRPPQKLNGRALSPTSEYGRSCTSPSLTLHSQHTTTHHSTQSTLLKMKAYHKQPAASVHTLDSSPVWTRPLNGAAVVEE